MLKYIIVLSFLVVSTSSFSQAVMPKEAIEIGEKLKQLPNLSYEYTVSRFYDPNNIDSIKGKLTNFKDQSIESSGEYLVIQDKKWFYKVNHHDKHVVVAKNSVFRSEESMSNAVSYFSDSAFYKFGKVNMVTEKSLVKISVTFGRETSLRSIYMEFDEVKGLPVLYKIVMDIPNGSNTETSPTDFVRQIFVARKFSSNKGQAKANLSDYFVLSGKDDVKLKKYSSYKLYKFL